MKKVACDGDCIHQNAYEQGMIIKRGKATKMEGEEGDKWWTQYLKLASCKLAFCLPSLQVLVNWILFMTPF